MSLMVFAGSAQIGRAAAAGQRCAAVGDLGHGAVRQPALRDLQRQLAAVLRRTCRCGSASRMAYFTADLNYVLFMRRFPEPGPAPEQVAVLLGRRGGQLGVVAGAVAARHRCSADSHPDAWGLGFAGMLACSASPTRCCTTARPGSPPAVAALRRGRGLRAAAEAEHRGRDRGGGGARPADRSRDAAARREPVEDDDMSDVEGVIAIVGLARDHAADARLLPSARARRCRMPALAAARACATRRWPRWRRSSRPRS